MPTEYKIKVDATGLGQVKAETCWLASYKMLYKASGRGDGTIRQDMLAAKLPYDDYYYNGLPRTDYVKAREALKLHSFSSTYIRGLADDAESMVYFLRSRGPIWTSIERNNKLHIILVNGVSGKMKQIYALNPWSNISAGEVETMVITQGDFKTWVTIDTASCQVCPTWPAVPFDPKET